MGKTYRSYQGKEVDMDKIMTNNELMPAVGNVRVNARGDELGPGGQIIRKREQIMSEYYEKQPARVKQPIKSVEKKETKHIEQTQSDSLTKRGNNDSKRQNSSIEE